MWGDRPFPKAELDRYPNNNGNYAPGNVRWATRGMNMRNTRRNRYVLMDGVKMCFADADKKLSKPNGWCRRMVIKGVYEEVC